jgi:hypothetical protein
MAANLIEITRPQMVAVLPGAKLVLMGRIGKPEPVACLRSVWAVLGLGWDRWELLLQTRCHAGDVLFWPGRDHQRRRTLLVTWHKVPAVLELLWQDLGTHAKPKVINDTAKLIRDWPDKRRLTDSMQPITHEENAGHTKPAAQALNAPEGLKNSTSVLAPKLGRVKILRAVHLPQVLKLLDDGLNTVQIAKAMGISRPAVSQMVNDTYQYKHD